MSDDPVKVEVARQLKADTFTIGTELSPGDAVARDLSRRRRHYVLIVSGMSSNSEWVSRLRKDDRFTQDEVEFVPIKSPALGLFRLWTRLFLSRPRASIAVQILNKIVEILQSDPAAPISIVCHSFGTDLVADVLKGITFNFHFIFLLGSICKTKKLHQLKSSCTKLFNDTASNDQYCILAAMTAPWFYEASGTFGFRENYAVEMCFTNNHDSCAEPEHVFSTIVPRLQLMDLPKHMIASSAFSFTAYNLARRAWWLVVSWPASLVCDLFLPVPHFVNVAAVCLSLVGIMIPVYYLLLAGKKWWTLGYQA